VVTLGEDERVGFEQEIERAVQKAHVSGDGDEHRLLHENTERPQDDVPDAVEECDVLRFDRREKAGITLFFP